ncbi:hypothetical protein INS49_011907 [Diaporthe citri]|uniref:uncharacterized protein n=1 Tax=Diaporthe citri TaxID=83186 RepID=UPI001C80EF91|nr:uncharacterized protein INS49_011907 [Diaporthe citri]KAG6360840.1 hypothetical protein INS49_011907 [Diaporthe citri]
MAQATSSQGHSGTSRPRLDTRDGFAAIDFGSTSTRAYLMTVNKKNKEQRNGYRVQNTGVDDYKTKRFLRGEWPSKGCPFDAPYPVGHDATDKEHADKRDRSLKSFVWFLADDDDQHPYTRDLKTYYDLLPEDQKAKFRKRLINMLVRHLAIVAEQIFREAGLRRTTMRRLVFCVPNAWDKSNFQNVLRPVMDKVAGVVETYCVFESEALAQFILHQHPYLLPNYEFVLVCDFGGHFMGGSLFQFCRDSDDDAHPAFFSLPQGNFGIRGGSQLWEDHIRPYIDDHLATLSLPADRESVLRAKFLDAFFIGKAEVDASFYESNMPMRLVVSITDVFPDDTNLYPLSLKPADISQAWQSGFRTAVDLALGKIRLLPASSRGRTVVILSGGSMLNYQARTEIQQACKGYGIDCRIMGVDFNPESCKWMVCEGAATAEACAASPREFFKRGAALAVQSYTINGIYESKAKVLFRGGRQAPAYSKDSHSPGQLGQVEDDRCSPVEIEMREYAHETARLVCDPLYWRHCHRYPRDYISIYSDDAAAAENNCYDVWDISRHFEVTRMDGTHHRMLIRPGKYVLEVGGIEYYQSGVDATLNLRMTRQATTAARARKSVRACTMSTGQDIYTFEVPLTACGPSNLVQLDLDKVKTRLWKPLQVRTELPQSVAEPESESAGELRPAGKRQRTVGPSVEELYNFGRVVVPADLFAKSRQQGSEGVAGDSLEASDPNMSFDIPGRSPSVTGTPIRTARSHRHNGRPRSGGRRHLPVRPPKGETRGRLSEMNNAYGSTDSDSDSDSNSDSSDIPDNSVNF